MKDNLKKIGKYLSILLLLVVGLAVVAMVFLFFVPSASLFGVCYVGADKKYTSAPYSLSDYNISLVSLENSSYPVRVVNSEDESISVTVYDKTFGYVLTKNSKVKISSKLIAAGDSYQLSLSVNEPHGFSYKGDSYISLKLPKKTNLNLSLKNKNAGAKFNLTDTTINTLTYTANSGDVALNSGTISNGLNLKLNRAHFVVGSGFNLQDATALVSLTSGKFDMEKNESSLKSLTLQKLETGTVVANNLQSLNLNLEQGGGKISIKSVTKSINLTSSDTNVSIGTLSGDGGRISLKSGKISIENQNCSLAASTSGGNISIGNVSAAAHLKSSSGNIVVKAAQIDAEKYNTSVWNEDSNLGSSIIDTPIWIENGDGSTSISFVSEGNLNRDVSILSSNGDVSVSGAHRVALSTTGKANASVNYLKVIGKSYLKATGSGSVSVQTPTNADLELDTINKYTLTTHAESGSVSILISQSPNLSGDTSAALHSTYVGSPNLYEQPEGEEWQNNVINVETKSGSIRVRNWQKAG